MSDLKHALCGYLEATIILHQGVPLTLPFGGMAELSGFTRSSLQLKRVAERIAKAKDNLATLEINFLIVTEL
ncbi:MAG: hypothetical protein RIG62_29045 [Cyclobacteriaceae bacterium]